MAAVGVAADVETYNVLINCCAAAHDVREGLRLAGQALREGHLADSYTINTLIKVHPNTAQHHKETPL
jgi:pentatricopeptide repeat protein